LTTAVLLASLIPLGGCGGAAKRTEVTYHDPAMDFSLIQTVAVLPFRNLTTNTNAAERVRDVFMTMLQATGAVYVVPPGEVGRGWSRANMERPDTPTPEEVVRFAGIVQTDVVITGTLREYGEARSGATSANLISLSVEMIETQTGRVVWSASSTKGGVKAADRVFGGGGRPMDIVTSDAVDDLMDKLFQ
jgi:hypothetical protein